MNKLEILRFSFLRKYLDFEIKKFFVVFYLSIGNTGNMDVAWKIMTMILTEPVKKVVVVFESTSLEQITYY